MKVAVPEEAVRVWVPVVRVLMLLETAVEQLESAKRERVILAEELTTVWLSSSLTKTIGEIEGVLPAV